MLRKVYFKRPSSAIWMPTHAFEKVGNLLGCAVVPPFFFLGLLSLQNKGFVMPGRGKNGSLVLTCVQLKLSTHFLVIQHFLDSIPMVRVQTGDHFWGHMLTWTHLCLGLPSSMTGQSCWWPVRIGWHYCKNTLHPTSCFMLYYKTYCCLWGVSER